MKRIICFFLSFGILFTLVGCRWINKADAHRDRQGYIQFMVEFNTGLFAYTNKESDLAYTPSNQKLQKEFEYGDRCVRFSADYDTNKIVYSVLNPSEDRNAENEVFADIYNLYLERWNYFCDKTDVGSLAEKTDENGIRSIIMTISGNAYTVTFSPNNEIPQIVYQVIAIS